MHVEKMKRVLSLLLACAMFAGPAMADETATLSVGKIKDLNLKIYGFMEDDIITDTTQSLTEEPDNSLIAKPDTFAGSNHRAIMSVRNSRLGFDFKVPTTESGIGTEGAVEMDFLGNQGINAAGGSTAGSEQSEANYFNNPTARIRHAWVNETYGELGLRVGQYWSLLGWQPYYFPAEPNVQPAVGQLYRRFPQARITDTHLFGPNWQLETAIGVAKPPEMNSNQFMYQGGMRIASTQYKAAVLSGAGTSMVGLSAGVSGDFVPLRTYQGEMQGGAVAGDFLIPIIPSSDGKDKSNNLSIMGEYCVGSGIGGLELASASFGVAQAKWTNPDGSTGYLDTGMAGINTSGVPELIHVRSMRISGQYVLPGGKWAVNGGYAQLQGTNLQDFSWYTGSSSTDSPWFSIAPLQQYAFVSLDWEALDWLRFGVEYSMDWDTYNTNQGTTASTIGAVSGAAATLTDQQQSTAWNDRFQFTTYFLF